MNAVVPKLKIVPLSTITTTSSTPASTTTEQAVPGHARQGLLCVCVGAGGKGLVCVRGRERETESDRKSEVKEHVLKITK